MKIRNGFVTNSSSSSFIIAFKDRNEAKESIRKAIKENPPRDYSWSGLTEKEMIEKTIEYMMRGIDDGAISIEDIKIELVDELKSRARWKFFYSTRNFDYEYLDTDEVMGCELCHKKQSSKTRCINGHFVCDECHTSGMDEIISISLLMMTE